MRKGQAATGAATVVGIITLMLVFYILLIPPEDRFELLENESFEDRFDTDDDEFGKGFLTEFVGHLGGITEDEKEHAIPNIFLVETKSAVEFDRFNPFRVSSSWFGSDDQVSDFLISDLDDAQNIILAFAARGDGTMRISLNGNRIFEGIPFATNTINLRKVNLREGTNTLEISVSGVGLRFWDQNSYDISDAKIIGDISDLGRQESTNIFTITENEHDNLESAKLSFVPYCDQLGASVLEIFLNNKKVSSSIPDCSTINRLDLFEDDLTKGRNTLVFRISKGSYRLENIRLETFFGPADKFAAFFEITKSNYTEIKTDQLDPWLNITFIDDGEEKEAEININGRLFLIDQEDAEYSREISNEIIEGNNYIEITPRTSLNIVKVEIIPRK